MPIVINESGDRTYEVEAGGETVKLTVGPPVFGGFYKAINWIQKAGMEIDDLGGAAGVHHLLMQRVTAWDGPILPDGSPAPCDEKTKMLFFGQFPKALKSLFDQVEAAREQEEKNSESSPSGSEMTESIPVSPAESHTDSEPEPK